MEINLKEIAKKQGENLKKLRLQQKLSIYRVALNSGLTSQQINAMEKGTSKYTHESFLKYLQACNIKMTLEIGSKI